MPYSEYLKMNEDIQNFKLREQNLCEEIDRKYKDLIDELTSKLHEEQNINEKLKDVIREKEFNANNLADAYMRLLERKEKTDKKWYQFWKVKS